MMIAIASGKGGTGKTLVASNLAWLVGQRGARVTYVDADVEAPNGHLFLHPEGVEEQRLTVPNPYLPRGSCSGCGDCQQVCAFNAILALEDRVMVFPELCHGCGACLLACKEHYLRERPREVGTLRRGAADGVGFWSGVLDVGEPRAVPVIGGLLAAVSRSARGDDELVVVDAPPGTSCNAVAVTRAADLVLLVTEPTPFGLHDLKLAVGMCRALDRPMAVVVNRADLGHRHELDQWLGEQRIMICGELSYSTAVARAYAAGRLAAADNHEVREALETVINLTLGDIP